MGFEFSQKANAFLNKLLDKALCQTFQSQKSTKPDEPGNNTIISCDADLPTFREMIDRQESSEFHQVFLSNKLCKQVQKAIMDQAIGLS